jgi:hypothetical protein
MATRALVLSGGGLVGVAWEAGLLAGLSESGVDVARADLILGTSAGSYVGAQVAIGRSASSIVDGILAEDPARSFSIAGRPMKVPDMSMLFARMAEAVSGARPAEQVRAEIGAWALSAETMSEKDFMASFGHSLGGRPEDLWPDPYACTAVDAADGSFMLWNKDSKVRLHTSPSTSFRFFQGQRIHVRIRFAKIIHVLHGIVGYQLAPPRGREDRSQPSYDQIDSAVADGRAVFGPLLAKLTDETRDVAVVDSVEALITKSGRKNMAADDSKVVICCRRAQPSISRSVRNPYG